MRGTTNRHGAGVAPGKSGLRPRLSGGARPAAPPDMSIGIPVIATDHRPGRSGTARTTGAPPKPDPGRKTAFAPSPRRVTDHGATPSRPILDNAALVRLHRNSTSDAFTRLIDSAVRETGERVRRIERAAAKINLESLDFEAITVVGMSDIFGLPRLKHHALCLVSACRSGNREEAAALARSFYPVTVASLTALRNWRP